MQLYIPFANTFIHPKLDILFFPRADANKFLLISPSFYKIQDHPVSKLRTVAVEVEYFGNSWDIDFSDHLYWMRALGCPQELVICPVTTRRDNNPMELLAEQYLIESEDIMDDGNKTHLMEWPSDVDGHLVREIKPKLRMFLKEESNMTVGFRVPKLAQKLFYANTNFW
jgi:hypothetical protein